MINTDLLNYYTKESVEIIEEFITYYKTNKVIRNTYSNSFRRIYELLKVSDIKLFTFQDYQIVQNSDFRGHSNQIFSFLYAKDYLRNPEGFSSVFGSKQKKLDRLEKHKLICNQPKRSIKNYTPALTTQNLDKLITFITSIDNNDIDSLKLAFCFHLLFYEHIPVTALKQLSNESYKNGYLSIPSRDESILVPKEYRFIWENVTEDKKYRGFSSLKDSIDKLSNIIGIGMCTPIILNNAGMQRFFQCPECGEKYLASIEYWKGINSFLVCNNCYDKMIAYEKKRMLTN